MISKKLSRSDAYAEAARRLEEDHKILVDLRLSKTEKYDQNTGGVRSECGTTACAGGWIGIRSPRERNRLYVRPRKMPGGFSLMLGVRGILKADDKRDWDEVICARYVPEHLDSEDYDALSLNVTAIFSYFGVNSDERDGRKQLRNAKFAMRQVIAALKKAVKEDDRYVAPSLYPPPAVERCLAA